MTTPLKAACPPRLKLTVNIRDFFNSRLARLSLFCHDQQAIFPEKILHTQEQGGGDFPRALCRFLPACRRRRSRFRQD